METGESKIIYKQRKVIVEPVFWPDQKLRFRGFSERGKEKVAGELSLVCATHNIKKNCESNIPRESSVQEFIKNGVRTRNIG